MNLQKLFELEDGPRKTAALTAWIQGRIDPGGSPPILVGGAAVELFTHGAYTTGGLDFVGEISKTLERDLEAAAHLDAERFEARVESSGWSRALASVREFARRWERDEPSEDEVEQWARAGR
jgi:hypothetical protein